MRQSDVGGGVTGWTIVQPVSGTIPTAGDTLAGVLASATTIGQLADGRQVHVDGDVALDDEGRGAVAVVTD